MKGRELVNLGMAQGPAIRTAMAACDAAYADGWKKTEVRQVIKRLLRNPDDYAADPIFGGVAAALSTRPAEVAALRDDLDYAVWGDEIDAEAHAQMRGACRLPVSVAAALMPDAHVGYGLPIGGVLATDEAVIPYAVGVDIACRVMLTVFDLPAVEIAKRASVLEDILESNTRFGIGAKWMNRPAHHEVMDEDWRITPMTAGLKELAWQQLGTSGSGNHFVEFGEMTFGPNDLGVAEGTYLALLSHSGSRGPGSKVANHYSRLAMELHPDLPRALRQLAWLPMNGPGAEYWAAMELMGRFASANHHVIHERIRSAVGGEVVFEVENHHNFAWRETHGGRDVIVHRKGATPAGAGMLGFIPGSMADPGYLVRGRGEASSLDSASHGAGRRMSRTAARESINWSHLHEHLRERGVTLLSAGLDESPHAYKNIDEVISAQADLVEPLAKFMPRIVKMAPDGERPED